MPYMSNFGLEFKEKLLSYLKSEPSDLSNCKLWCKSAPNF